MSHNNIKCSTQDFFVWVWLEKDSKSREMFKVIRSRGIVTKETIVFIGPDLGHARTTTPADQRRRWIIPCRLFSLLWLGSFPHKKLPLLGGGLISSCDNAIKNRLIFVDGKYYDKKKKVSSVWHRWNEELN